MRNVPPDGVAPNISEAIRKGHYARKQIFSKDWLISWSHRSRFQIGLGLARQFSGKRILDYGCGDGTFLAMLMAGPWAASEATGAEMLPRVVEDCRARFRDQPSLRFIVNDELKSPEHANAYDAIICMEVLEHVVDIEPVLDTFARSLAPSGKLLVSVPIETGLPLMVKQAARRIAGWRGIGDYPGTSPYTLREYFASVFAGRKQSITRPVYKDEKGNGFHDHKGFNWMALGERLSQRFVIEKTFSSPVAWLPPQLASQVWFLARSKQ